jgi:hypothetical protein
MMQELEDLISQLMFLYSHNVEDSVHSVYIQILMGPGNEVMIVLTNGSLSQYMNVHDFKILGVISSYSRKTLTESIRAAIDDIKCRIKNIELIPINDVMNS